MLRGISLCQHKNVIDSLKETGLLGSKPIDTPMDINPGVWDDSGEFFKDKAKYRRLVGKLLYLTITRRSRPNISFAVGVVGRLMDKPLSLSKFPGGCCSTNT